MKSGEKLLVNPSSSFRTEDFVNYFIASASDTPLPYISARLVVNQNGMLSENFVLGKADNSPISRRKRAIPTGEFYNGPLQEGQYYIVSQRFFDTKVRCYKDRSN